MTPRQDNDSDDNSLSTEIGTQLISDGDSAPASSSLRLRGGRFDRTAERNSSIDEPCIIIIDGLTLDVASWARSHPGGVAVLRKFHNKNATRDFRAAHHSERARNLMKRFAVAGKEGNNNDNNNNVSLSEERTQYPRWIRKLVTHEDPYQLHKCLGLFCLLNYSYRFALMLFGDPTAGFGSSRSKHGLAAFEAVLCLIPHAMLSLSSLIFRRVPKERIVGRPVIWREFRAHNIIFATRSVVCSVVAWLSLYHNHAPAWRTMALYVSGSTCLVSNVAASWATKSLRHDDMESTTATMPYWEGCSDQTEKVFKHFYALAQFGATVGCMMTSNPAWPLAILLPIQGASFLMTLVRKGIISTMSYHMAYAFSLLLVFAVGVRQLFWMWSLDLVGLFVVAIMAYQGRRWGANKFLIWIPIVLLRTTVGDDYLQWDIW